jgi:hypothetical protein
MFAQKKQKTDPMSMSLNCYLEECARLAQMAKTHAQLSKLIQSLYVEYQSSGVQFPDIPGDVDEVWVKQRKNDLKIIVRILKLKCEIEGLNRDGVFLDRSLSLNAAEYASLVSMEQCFKSYKNALTRRLQQILKDEVETVDDREWVLDDKNNLVRRSTPPGLTSPGDIVNTL